MTFDAVQTREDAWSLLDGYSEEAKVELNANKTRRPLVKSYMLETVRRDQPMPTLTGIFDQSHCSLIRLDDTLFKVHDRIQDKTLGLVEQLLDRYPVLYTYEDTRTMDPWVSQLVRGNRWLDHLWLSGRAFEQLLMVVLRLAPAYRYGRIVFQHESLFEPGEMPPAKGLPTSEDEDEDSASLFTQDDVLPAEEPDVYVVERRSARFTITERLEILKTLLPRLQDLYNPLHAVAQIRFPARGRGGHDFYFNGKVTNRSDSFTDHRQHVQFVLNFYRRATEQTELAVWQSKKLLAPPTPASPAVITGAPVLIEFSHTLSTETFTKFIRLTFNRKENRFRLWGNPIELGPHKYHVYGLDRHIWQPIFLEITPKHIVAIIPDGTCGNSVHRLITNIQQYLDPAVQVWIGDRPYSDMINADENMGALYDSE